MQPHRNSAFAATTVWHDSLPSTMSEAALLASQGAAHGSCVAALAQTQGRGRHGNTWWSPKGSGVWATFILQLPCGHQPEGLSIVAGLAVMRCVHRLGATTAGLKWPNDVLALGRKLAGVLVQTDLADRGDGHYTLLLGIGINLRAQAAASGAKPPAEVGARHIGLDELTATNHDPSEVLAALKQDLQSCWNTWYDGGLTPLLAEINAHHLLAGRQVRATGPGGTPLCGHAVGITSQGELLLQDRGQQVAIRAGEVCEVRPTKA